jgi:hypothetical protein
LKNKYYISGKEVALKIPGSLWAVFSFSTPYLPGPKFRSKFVHEGSGGGGGRHVNLTSAMARKKANREEGDREDREERGCCWA